MHAVAIAVFEGAEELDFVGPWEVLAAWRHLHPDEVSVSLVGDTLDPVTCAKGMRVLPAFGELLPLGRDIEPRPDDRFVDAGPIITAAGVSAGIDMALHLVGRLVSPERSRDVRRYIQYDPQPPY